MKIDLADLNAFVAVARASGFRDGARASGGSASGPERGRAPSGNASSASGCSIAPRAVWFRPRRARACWSGSTPALTEVEAALDVVNRFRDRPAGTLKLNVPVSAARLVLPAIVPAFLAAYPDIRLEVIVEESFVDVLAAGCDAGIRYGERLEQDMIAVPIGPRQQRFAVGAAPAYLDRHGRPKHPRDLLDASLSARAGFRAERRRPGSSSATVKSCKVEPTGPLIVSLGGAIDLLVDAAIAGTGIVPLFEDWLRPHFESGALEPVLEPWWQCFAGPFLYYPGRRLVPAPLRAFVDFIKVSADKV